MLHRLDLALRWTSGLMAAAALFAIMWLTLVDVSGRKFLSHSVPGGLELTEMLMVVVIFGALPLVSSTATCPRGSNGCRRAWCTGCVPSPSPSWPG